MARSPRLAKPQLARRDLAQKINAAGEIVGWYGDSDNVLHGFIRAVDGTITAIDPPDAGTTFAFGINDAGITTGYYLGASNHGFVRAANGAITTIDVPGAGLPVKELFR